MIVLATQNAGKVAEFRAPLTPLGITLATAAEAGVHTFPPETGATFTENAVQKAQFVCEATGRAALADDSGLQVVALGGEPGVHSARFGGPGLTDTDRTNLLLTRLQGKTNRAASFVSAIALALPSGRVETFVGEVHGEITAEPRGSRGFGYDPVFYVQQLACTFAEASIAEKEAISHRGIALRKFAAWLGAHTGVLTPER